MRMTLSRLALAGEAALLFAPIFSHSKMVLYTPFSPRKIRAKRNVQSESDIGQELTGSVKRRMEADIPFHP